MPAGGAAPGARRAVHLQQAPCSSSGRGGVSVARRHTSLPRRAAPLASLRFHLPPTTTWFKFLQQVKRQDVPLELEEIGLPMNTFGPKNPFTGACLWGKQQRVPLTCVVVAGCCGLQRTL